MPRPAPAQPRPHIRKSGPPSRIDPDSMILWTYEELAAKTGLSIGHLRRRVLAGTGPRVTHVGRHHRFTPRDVDSWVAKLRRST